LISAIQTEVAVGVSTTDNKKRGLVLTIPNPAVSPVYLPVILE
jgi:hypothetical protein